MLRLLALAVALPGLQFKPADPASLVSEARLRANLTYIASDELGGRGTPSKGLDQAADFIARSFKDSGLEPVDGSYFQLAPESRLNREGEPTVKNVVGIHRGTDHELKDTWVLVTAHYDHVGTRASGEGDLIFNGANDNGSGTVSVMEIAKALIGVETKRSILFMCFFGEERGLQGANYYGDHPIVALDKTVAMLNIEMVGRTNKISTNPSTPDAIEDWTGKLGVTGFDMSDLGSRLAASGKKAGIEVVMDPYASTPFFNRSDNAALARRGVVAHTVSVGYADPEYHKANDHAETINYANMTNVVKALVYATLDLANDAAVPKWTKDNIYAKPYRLASEKLYGVRQ